MDALETKRSPRPRNGALDFGWRYADAIAFLKDLVRADRQAIDTDQKVLRLAARHALAKECGNGGSRIDVDVVRETGAIVIDVSIRT